MISALFYLRLTSLKNSLVARFRRLKQPKYLFGAFAGLAYFWFFFFRHFFNTRLHGAGALSSAEILPLMPNAPWPLVGSLGALALLVIVALAWIIPSQKGGFGFSEAEIAFLFPAPVSRRMLINYKLVSSQFTILFTAFFFTLVSNRWGFLQGGAVLHALGWWLLLSVLNLHFAAATLTLARLLDRGVSPLRRRLLFLGVGAVLVAGTVCWVWRDLPAPTTRDSADADSMVQYLLVVLNGGALGWLLWPFRLAIAPFLAADFHRFLLALGPSVLLLALHYFWVMRLEEVSFEEASISMAEKRSARIARARAGKFQFGAEKAKARRGPFFLRDTGHPEWAFLWKNLLSTRPYFNVRTLAVCAAIIVVGSRWLSGSSEIANAFKIIPVGFSAFAGVYIILFGPYVARQDLRNDLANADVLKTYPLPGWRLVLGQILTPLAILTGLIWLALLTLALLVTPTGTWAKTFSPGVLTMGAICAAAIAPLLLALQLLVLNGTVIVFPGWSQTSRVSAGGGGGIEVMGQRLIFVFGSMLVVIAAIIPSVIAAGIVMGSLYGIGTAIHFFGGGEAHFLSPFSITAALLAVFAILLGEVWLALRWLGRRFESFDLSAELRP